MPTVLTFHITVFLGAALLFVLQPMVARMLLPMFGGSAGVWTLCVVTYQALLLAGYAYAHALAGWSRGRWHVLLHVAVLGLAATALPVHVTGGLTAAGISASPIGSLLRVLIGGVGLPFFALAATGPLLQVWLARSRHPAGRDPYFLYGASNLGSLAGLLSFPFVVEPLFSAATRARIWTAMFGLFIGLVVVCAALAGAWRGDADDTGTDRARTGRSRIGDDGSGVSRGRLLLLAFAPASLTLGVTTFLLTNLAAVPLFWVVPLALYLLSFVIAFGRRAWIPHALVQRLFPAVLLFVVVLYLFGFDEPWWFIIPAHLAMLFAAALMCHGALARARPPASELTTFYLWLSAGGVLGGLFNALAPVLFDAVLEYPLVMALVAFLVPPGTPRGVVRVERADVAAAAGVGALTAALIAGVSRAVPAGPLSAAMMFGPPAVVCYTFRGRPIRFGTTIALMMAACVAAFPSGGGERLLQARSFFGVSEVRNRNGFHALYHGNTIHGVQSPDPARRLEPLGYYHPTSPIGDLFREYANDLSGGSIAVVGLGAGSLAGYAQAGQQWTFYEIDPIVVRIARDPRLFTFLIGARAPVGVVLGDARLSLNDSGPARHRAIVLDAFNSDAVPVHLLTREAVGLYLSRLDDRGLLAFNVSNRYLALKDLMASIARDAGLTALARDGAVTTAESRQGKLASTWVVMARDAADLSRLAADPRWQRLVASPAMRSWSDDRADIFSVLRFGW